ncbi:hypothetical protein RHGRI_011725 [Rhododendron griersonianum]|uniref:Uncharacterized protein n=1 Tax=Rhododendron griersonianum TaxID=479676 RepID=A0AAV6KPG7_9ERIC|nr:hypothetical protein RHGRI_011725 [Rhododendron griersonianum]
MQLVELPKVEPQFKAPFLGFTRTAEIWNSRACMIGLIGTFVVELIVYYLESLTVVKGLRFCFSDLKQGNTSIDWSGYWERSGSSSMSNQSK